MIRVSRSDLTRVIVAIDPAATDTEDSDDTGIVVVARGPHQTETCKLEHCPGHGYVLADATCHLPPTGWAQRAVDCYHEWQADRVIAEVNNGGDMVGAVIRAIESGLPYDTVRATRGKLLRAEPVSALYSQGRVHHIGVFAELEVQQQTWTPEARWSPDRLDALVWGLTYLGLIGAQGHAFQSAWKREVATRGPVKPPELARVPSLGGDDRPGLAPHCKHRFFDGRCVHCNGPVPPQP